MENNKIKFKGEKEDQKQLDRISDLENAIADILGGFSNA